MESKRGIYSTQRQTGAVRKVPGDIANSEGAKMSMEMQPIAGVEKRPNEILAPGRGKERQIQPSRVTRTVGEAATTGASRRPYSRQYQEQAVGKPDYVKIRRGNKVYRIEQNKEQFMGEVPQHLHAKAEGVHPVADTLDKASQPNQTGNILFI